MTWKHFGMFIIGFLLQDLKELIAVGIKLLIKKIFNHKHKTFDEKAPILHKLKEEISLLSEQE